MAFSMSFSVSDEMNLFSQEFQNYLSPSSLQQLAKEVGFVQRTTKYQAQELIALCVWFSQQSRVTPLTQLCSRLEASTGVLMSPEGSRVLHKFCESSTQRIHSHKKYFIHTPRLLNYSDPILHSLPCLHYQGSGGSSHTAGVKIH